MKVFDPGTFPEGQEKEKAYASVTVGSDQSYRPITSFTREEKMRRATAYAATMDPAIEGDHGDDRTYQKACSVGRGFDLSVDDTLEALQAWNARCQPPWREEELRVKVENAMRYSDEPIGWRLTVPRPNRPHAKAHEQSRTSPTDEPGEKNSEMEFSPEETATLASVLQCPTEDNVAALFEERYAELFRYCKVWGQWLKWDGTRWQIERTDMVFDFCRRLSRSINTKQNRTIAKRSFSVGVEAFARTARCFATESDQWNRDDFTLNTPAGTFTFGEKQ